MGQKESDIRIAVDERTKNYSAFNFHMSLRLPTSLAVKLEKLSKDSDQMTLKFFFQIQSEEYYDYGVFFALYDPKTEDLNFLRDKEYVGRRPGVLTIF